MKKSRLVRSLCTYLFTFTCCLGSSLSTAAVLYNNIDPGDLGISKLDIGIDIADNDVSQGFLFTAQSSGAVTSIDAVVGYGFGSSPGNMLLGLYSDSSGTIGALLEQITMSVTNSWLTDGAAIINASAIGSTSLTAGVNYWLVGSSPDGNLFNWNQSTIGDNVTRAVSSNNLAGPYIYYSDPCCNPYGAFRINSIPIPSAVWLFGSGLLGLVGMARRKKAA